MATKPKNRSATIEETIGSALPNRSQGSADDPNWTGPQPGAAHMDWTDAIIPEFWGADRTPSAPRSIMYRNGQEVSGESILALARQHLTEPYSFGARAPMGNPNWKGPWDCAEFVSWCLYQAAGILFGTEPRNDPIRADAYTGFWAQQARAGRCTIPLSDAVVIPGAILLRYPQMGAIGHIAFSDGNGGTLEAHSRKLGVIEGTAIGRRWDTGVLVPGIRYFQTGNEISITPPTVVIRLTEPLTKSVMVKQIQQRLVKLGYAPGSIDSVYGPQTAAAVKQLQIDAELVVDGEVGPATLKALQL